MKLVVISPEGYEPREHAVLAQLFAVGLERYHVRKPQWTEHVLRNFVRLIPEKWRARLVLHQHHDLAEELGCGGVHYKEANRRVKDNAPYQSRSCHTLKELDWALGSFDSVFFSPVFPSISKSGYVPSVALDEVAAVLGARNSQQRKTSVIALGGITPVNAARCAELGFDGVAVLGTLWQAVEPVKVFEQLQQVITANAV